MSIFNIFHHEETNNFKQTHQVGGLLHLGEEANTRILLQTTRGFVVPRLIDERPRFTPTEDQGSSPMCAAYSMSQYAENMHWRKTGIPQNTDPKRIYIKAKEIDGMAEANGTTIDAVLRASLMLDIFDKSQCSVKHINPTVIDIKFALHKYGAMLVGFNITEEWYDCEKKKTAICSKENLPGIGGHCVTACGYDEKGLYILNSWGVDWGSYGYALITWKCVMEQFMDGGVIEGGLNGIKSLDTPVDNEISK